MKDMGKVDVILGMKTIRTSDGYALSQSHYVKKILEKFNKNNLRVARTPINENVHLTKNIEEIISQMEYSRIIGKSYVFDELYKTRYSICNWQT